MTKRIDVDVKAAMDALVSKLPGALGLGPRVFDLGGSDGEVRKVLAAYDLPAVAGVGPAPAEEHEGAVVCADLSALGYAGLDDATDLMGVALDLAEADRLFRSWLWVCGCEAQLHLLAPVEWLDRTAFGQVAGAVLTHRTLLPRLGLAWFTVSLRAGREFEPSVAVVE